MSLEIESADVIRLVQQFLKENNLLRTLDTLYEETSVTLNSVDSIESFKNSITQGKWDTVMKTVGQLKIPQKKLMDLYEQMIIELIEMREMGAARSLLRQTEPMHIMKEQYPERYLHLEHLLSLTTFNEREAYPNGTSKSKRRNAIAESLAAEVTVVKPSRLLTLLGQAMKWQYSQGMVDPEVGFDLFQGTSQTMANAEDKIPTERFQKVKYPKKSAAGSACFSPDGQFFVTGTADGFIEVLNYMTGKIRKDLKYQAEDNFMSMEDAILCTSFSSDSEFLATGSQDGKIKVWKVSTGQCTRRFPAAHAQGVTSIAFNKDGSRILSGGYDHVARIHGLKSGKMLTEFRGHTSFVNDVVFLDDGAKVATASSDGSVKIWDVKTASCVSTLNLYKGQHAPAGTTSPTVYKVIPNPTNPSQIYICNKSNTMYLVSINNGQIVKTYSLGEKELSHLEFASMAVSPKGEYLYGVAENGVVYVFGSDSKSLITQLKVTDAEVSGIVQHPSFSVFAVLSEDGIVGIWK